MAQAWSESMHSVVSKVASSYNSLDKTLKETNKHTTQQYAREKIS